MRHDKMKILLATDGSESARAAVGFLDRFPLPKDSELTLLTVIDRQMFREEEAKGLSEERRRSLKDTEKVARQEGEQLLASEAARLRKAGWGGSTELRLGHPAEEIVHVAERIDADLVIVGSHGRTGMKRFLLGSVSDHVLEYAPCSVLIVKALPMADVVPGPVPDSRERRFRVLLAFDDSQPARKAAELCAALPLGEEVEVTAVSVLPLVTLYRQDIRQRLSWVWHEKKKAARAALEWVTKEVRWATPHVSAELRESADVSHEILDVATEMNSDLIMLGHKGKGAIEKFLLGSVTTRVAHHAHCSVLAVRK
jgi:nucleotide-binding universal stress UspA family protein